MPVITRIMSPKGRPDRRRVYLDGRFAFLCHLNVVARFRLREGLVLDEEQLQRVMEGQRRQTCMDQALRYLQRRQHSREELRRKLLQRGHPVDRVEEVLGELKRLDYVDDERFARTRAEVLATQKRFGPVRIMAELLKCGVAEDTAERVVHAPGGLGGQRTDGIGSADQRARALIEKHAARLQALDRSVARRRLEGLLYRHGFDEQTVQNVLNDTPSEPASEP